MRVKQTARVVSAAVLFCMVWAASGCRSGEVREEAVKEGGSPVTEASGNPSRNRIRLEHVAINVKDPEAMAEWYCRNLGMKISRKLPAPAKTHFISDSEGNMMLEIYNNPPDEVPDYSAMNPLRLHIAFMVDDVKAMRKSLIQAGATPVDLMVTESGDEIAMLRDPWGVPIQFVDRAEPMLSFK